MVVTGTGLYLGASGTLSGGGTIVFDENGVPPPGFDDRRRLGLSFESRRKNGRSDS